MGKIYKSAMGKNVDIGALILQNETVRAVGNMKVNARGDLIDGNNQVIQTKQSQVQDDYRRQNKPTAKTRAEVAQPQEPAKLQTAPQKAKVEKPEAKITAPAVAQAVAEIAEENVDFPQDVQDDDVEVVKSNDQPQGLAAAIQKAREQKKQ